MAVIRVFVPMILLLISSLISFEIGSAAREMGVIKPGHDTVARLGGEGDAGVSMDCWSALLELKSCTNEIVLFFLNGESYLSMDCCRAIRVITYNCWPSMLTSLGYSSEEGDILRDYCGGSSPPQPDTFKDTNKKSIGNSNNGRV